MIHLVIGNAQRHRDIGGRMSLRKQILNLFAGLEVPRLNAMRNHIINIALLKSRAFFSFSDRLHNFKGLELIHTKMNQIFGPLNICGIYVLCSDYLPPIVKDFLEQYPGVNITLEHQISVNVLERVLAGKSDLGFCADFNFQDKKFAGLEYVHIKQDDLILITSLDHPLASDTAVSLEQLKDEDFILNGNPNTRNRIDFLNLCREYDFTPKITFEPADDQSIIGMVYAGLGISCMANIPSVHRGNLHVLKILEEHVPVQSYYMIWRRDAHLSLAAKTFKDYVLSSLDSK